MKNLSLRLAMAAIFIPVLMNSCKQVVTDEKPGSHARISEVLVIMDKQLWKGEMGDTVRNFFGQFFPYLNQPEAWFSIIHRTPEEFNKTYSIYRNILVFTLEPELDGGTIQKEEDYWARPQTVIQLKGPDRDALYDLFVRNSDAILQVFDQNEVRRLKRVMKSISKPVNAQKIKKELGINISVPDGYYIANRKENFIWVRKVIRSKTQESAYWITAVPYSDTSQFNPEMAMALRDSICKANIPVQDEESYMGTEYRFGYQNRIIDVNGAYTLETRGFWRTFGTYSMGGPFLNFLIHDKEHNRLIMIDTYVFRPNENKRDLIRQLEGIVHTLEL